jgi:hypothetical protein
LANLNNAITFTFAVRGDNIFGTGPFTNSISVETIGPPDKMSEVTLVQNGTYVTIQWQIPPSNGGTIDTYKIMLLNWTSNTYLEVLTLCDGSNPAILNCTMSMTDFISQLGYVGGQAIKAIA